MRRTTATWCAVLALALSAGVRAQKSDTSQEAAAVGGRPEVIWRSPGATASLDLIYGVGGKVGAPTRASTYTFVKEDVSASSPKFDVIDGDGAEWKVKLGEESQSETAATRLLWAAGYFTDEDYYVAEMTVTGLPTLRRGQKDVTAGNVIHDARLERKRRTIKKLAVWDWFNNPFMGQRELNGLRVMMSLVNNWDLKAVNNAVYLVDGEHRYAISDLGASFGKTGNTIVRSKGVPKDYQDSAFIAGTTPDSVDFVLHSRPFFLWVFAESHYRERTRMEKITRHIPRADARWLGQRLALLTDDQIRDGFRAAGYGASDVEMLANTVRRRIAVLGAL